MKKLIILFCGTLALAACGNGLEKKPMRNWQLPKLPTNVATTKKPSRKSTVSKSSTPKPSKHAKRDRH